MSELLPIGIYTIPISVTSVTEEELTDSASRMRSVSHGIASLRAGRFGRHATAAELHLAGRRTILGVHVLGTNATAHHIGQTVMGLGGTIDYLVDTVFNYPTLAESYKVAALYARNRLMAVERIVR